MRSGSSNAKSDKMSLRRVRVNALRVVAMQTVLVLAAGMMHSCREENKIDVAARLNPDRMPTMTTINVSTLISDSGVIQYKIVAPMWRVYDRADTPYWIFPKGLYLQKYDRFFHVIATVAADSAKYFKNQKLWRLDGNVEMTKVPKDLFQSQQLFWDQTRGRIYSDSFIHIQTPTHVLEGIGFESNERLTSYRIIKPQGIFPVNRDEITSPGAGAGGGSVATTTVSVNDSSAN